MGGAAKHIQHVVDDEDLTIADVKNIVNGICSGLLLAQEKFDGLNIMFSMNERTGDVLFARNISHIKCGGLRAQEIVDLYDDRLITQQALRAGLEAIESGYRGLSQLDKLLIKPGWYSAEIIYTPCANVIQYDCNAIVFHCWPFYVYDNGELVKSEALPNNLHKMSCDGWTFLRPPIVNVNVQDVDKYIKYIGDYNRTITDDMRISDVIASFLLRVLNSNAYDIPEHLRGIVVQKALHHKGAPSMTDLKKREPSSVCKAIETFIKDSPSLMKRATNWLRLCLIDFADELLGNAYSILISDKSAVIDLIRQRLSDVGVTIQNVNAIEGVVFSYRGKYYKLTGSFPKINAALGASRYSQRKADLANRPSKVKERELEAVNSFNKASAELSEWYELNSKLNIQATARGLKKAISEFDRAKAELAPFFPHIVSYNVKHAIRQQKKQQEFDAKSFMSVSDVSPLLWNNWPSFVVDTGIPFGSVEVDEQAPVGVGPGELWLAYMFGGKNHGASSTHDITMEDGTKWEVKYLDTKTDDIRPGTCGLLEFEKSMTRLRHIMHEMQQFTSAASLCDEVKFISGFIECNADYIKKGEISLSRFIALKSAMNAVKRVIDRTCKKTFSITIEGCEHNVDHRAFMNAVRELGLTTYYSWKLTTDQFASSYIKDVAFEDPDNFVETWFSDIKPSQMFPNVDGIFVVNRHGYMILPWKHLDSTLKLCQVSMGKPRFNLINELWR